MAKKLPIFYSALLLTGVNLLLRLVGTSFQVYLSGRIGADGIGLLQLVLSVGSMALVAGMAGIRTATMYLTAEEIGRCSRHNTIWVLSGALHYSILCSIAVGAGTYLAAPFLAEKWIGNVHTVDSIRIFSVFLPVNCLSGVMVGYFTGANRIGTLAAVEVAEQLFSMMCTMLLLQFWAGHNPERACQAVVLGSGMAACLTLCALTVLRLAESQKTSPQIPIAGRLMQTACPLALADDLRTGITTVENLMVPKRLALYPGVVSPLAAFGTVCGMVFPVLMFPAAILFGLTELLVPELARCKAAGSRRRISYLVQKSLRLSLLYGTFCAGILFLAAPELCDALYGSRDAGRYLRWFAPLAVMLYCDSVTDAMIKGLGQQTASVRYNITTNVMDVVLLYILLPRCGITGYFASFLVTHLLNFALSLRRLLRITKEEIAVTAPMIALLAAAVCVWLCQAVAAVFIRCCAYVLVLTCVLYLLRVIRYEDIRWIQGMILQRAEKPISSSQKQN